MADALLVIEAALPHEIPHVLLALQGHLPIEQRAPRVEQLLESLDTGELTPEGILVARRSTQILGAILCNHQEGASGLVWLPRSFETSPSNAVEDALVRAAHLWMQQSGCKLSQAVLTFDELARARPLLHNGFRHVTRMHWMRHDLHVTHAEALSLPASLTMESPFGPLQRAFEATLLKSYEGSADFPELNNLRTVEEILAGHEAPADTGPPAWWLACVEGRPVGVLLLADLGETLEWELSYLGVITAMRGQGLGKALTRFALDHVRAVRGTSLFLTVDERNESARRLYANAGFAQWYSREVLLCVYPLHVS